MVHSDFDANSLAAYLHITPQQVERLASRGKLPGRKVAGAWRFSRADIHHLLEERLGLMDEDEMGQVENVLRRSAPGSDEQPISLSDLIPHEAIGTPLLARTRRSVIQGMVNLAQATGMLWDAEKMVEAVRAREEMQSTALDVGAALLHARRPMAHILSDAFIALGITSQGIPFGTDGTLCDVFFLICSVDDREHLRTLARLSRLISTESFLDEIRGAPNAAEVKALLNQFESTIEHDH